MEEGGEGPATPSLLLSRGITQKELSSPDAQTTSWAPCSPMDTQMALQEGWGATPTGEEPAWSSMPPPADLWSEGPPEGCGEGPGSSLLRSACPAHL